MRVYRVSILYKFIFIGLLLVAILLFLDESNKNILRGFIALVLATLGVYVSFILEVRIDNEKMLYVHRLWPVRKNMIRWDEVRKIECNCLFAPEIDSILRVHSINKFDKSPITIVMTVMPLELLQEILNRVNEKTIVELDPYWKRRLRFSK